MGSSRPVNRPDLNLTILSPRVRYTQLYAPHPRPGIGSVDTIESI